MILIKYTYSKSCSSVIQIRCDKLQSDFEIERDVAQNILIASKYGQREKKCRRRLSLKVDKNLLPVNNDPHFREFSNKFIFYDTVSLYK